MREPQVLTLADARRQVRWRGVGGGLLMLLALIFLVLMLLKQAYQTPDNPLAPWGPPMRRFIDSILGGGAVLALLWRAIPPWQPLPLVPTTAMWDLVYGIWGALIVIGVGGFLLRSAHRRRAQITEFHQVMQRETWLEQARTARGVAPADHGATTVIGQAIWHQYPAPPESWFQRPWAHPALCGILGLSSVLAREPQLRHAHDP